MSFISEYANSQVRIEAALALRTLAEVDPTCVGGLTSYGVTNLTALRESMSFEKVKFVKFHDNLYLIACFIIVKINLLKVI